MVNAWQDEDHRFDAEGTFGSSFALAGGRFFVIGSERTASAIAHETGHMFWATDEYAGGAAYLDRRGYYGTQNLNAYDGNPNPDDRVRSIMDLHSIAYADGDLSPSAAAMVGWQDSDGDGLFDVLDVPLTLSAQWDFDPASGELRVSGQAGVGTLPNKNPYGLGNAITINQVQTIEYRLDEGPWRTAKQPNAYQSEFDFQLTLPPATEQIALRARDTRTDVRSQELTYLIADGEPPWQNVQQPSDVNGDGVTSPLDALLIINRLNRLGAGPIVGPYVSGPLLDTNADGWLSPLDALLVINELNQQSATPAVPTARPADAQVETGAQGEWRLPGELALPVIRDARFAADPYNDFLADDRAKPLANRGVDDFFLRLARESTDRDKLSFRTIQHRAKLRSLP